MSASTRVPVLMYHRVGITNNPWEERYGIRPADFSAHMETLARSGYQAVPIDTLVNWLKGGAVLPERAFVLTFDDGFRGVLEHALPVLERLEWPCTIFLVSDLIGGEDVWTKSENPAGVSYPLLNEGEIQDMLHRNVSFHSHSRSHADLPTLDDVELTDQLTSPRRTLSMLVGHDVPYIAYPFGHVDERVEAATMAAGYRAAFSTQPGFNRRNVNPFRIRRLDVFGTDTPAMLMRKIRFGTNDGSLAHASRYYFDRLKSHLTGAKR